MKSQTEHHRFATCALAIVAGSFFGGDYDAMLKDCVVEIGRDVGHMLTCLRTPEESIQGVG